MKFIMTRKPDATNYNNDEKVVIAKVKTQYNTVDVLSLAYLETVRKDFDLGDPFLLLDVVTDTASVQIRPKAIYHNEKGYYKKADGEKVFFSEEETSRIINAVYLSRIFVKKTYELVEE